MSRKWRIVAGILGAFVLCIAGTVVWIRSMTAQRWGAMEAHAREWVEEARRRDPTRPVLRGVAEPGNAWDDYEAAIKPLGDKTLTWSSVEGVSKPARKFDRAAAEVLLSRFAPSIALLRRGAGRAQAQYPYQWDSGFMGAASPKALECQRLAGLAVTQAFVFRADGRPAEAAQLLLDAALYCRDLGHNGTLLSELSASALLAVVLDDLKLLILEEKADPALFGQIGRELEILERILPDHGVAVVNDVMFMQAWATKDEASFRELGDDLSSWRYGFSMRMKLAVGFDEYEGLARRVAAAEALSWSDVRAESTRVSEIARASKNDFVRLVFGGVGATATASTRQRRAATRLLRIAAHFRVTGDILDLNDPYGTKIRAVRSGATLKAWSVGANGGDDGGTGTDWRDTRTGDVVIEVER